MPAKQKFIGLTGNIACGKSVAARMLRALGAFVIDADQIARDITKPGTIGLRAVHEAFGGHVLTADGQLDRAKLREIAFADPVKRKKLETILHPLIATESLDRASDAFQRGHAIVIYEAPLLVEADRIKDLHGLICVTCAPAVQMERLLARDGLQPEIAQKIMAAQMPQQEKAGHADWVIENDGSEADLQKKIDALWKELQRK